jgi:uncharacterized protein (DUF1800 family)
MRRLLTRTAVVVGLALAGSGGLPHSSAATFPTDDRAIVHVLNRIGFGPRPGDVSRVRDIGLQRYIDQQLRPDRIADVDTDARLAGLTTLGMSAEQIRSEFEQPQIEARRRRQLALAGTPASSGTEAPPPPSPEMQARNNQVMLELAQQKLLRAIYSERQLQEVLTDFWFNHFNVDARKGRDRFLLTPYERDAIRPHVLGRFRDLLEATAKSPAMLFYLDNWMSVDPNLVDLGARNGTQAGNRQKRGLNENYGRELMELHTLGVDGGYTQHDVTEVARAFTGWTIGNPRQGGGYSFAARLHDRGEKLVLGHRIKAGGGESDGEQVLDILASHPSTARFIATKLVRRFVSDSPPASLVDRVAARFIDTDGDIREMMRTIVTSREFLAPDAYRAKVKSPFEFIVSAMRATGAEIQDPTPLVRAVQQLGMPLYACQPPTGYQDTADAWINTGALVNRMNLALAVASDRMRGITVDSGQAALDVQAIVKRMLNGDVSDTTRATIGKATTAAQMTALTLGSPEFQRR